MSENITILNNSKTRNKYFLAIDYDGLTNDEIGLLRKMKLLIKNSKGDLLTDSNLANKNKHSLGVYQADEGEELTVTLSLPSDANNEYSKIFAKILWRFSYENVERKGENPYTGDFQFDLSITAFLLSSLGLLIVLILGKKDTDDIEKNKKRKRKRK